MTNGTDNHLLLVDAVRSRGVPGGVMQDRLDRVGITLNKNMVPDDPRSARDPSGIRLGTPALTTRGMGPAEMRRIAEILLAVARTSDEAGLHGIREEVVALSRRSPVPGVF